MQSLLKATLFVNLTRAFSALIFSPLFLETKKGESGFLLVVLVLWSFSHYAVLPSMAIAMIITITAAAIPIV